MIPRLSIHNPALGGCGIVCLLMALPTAAAAADDARIETFVVAATLQKTRELASREQDLERTRELLALAKRGRVQPGSSTVVEQSSSGRQYRFGSAEDKRTTIERLQGKVNRLPGEIAQIEAQPFVLPRLDAFALEVGQIGILDYGPHVVGATPMTFDVQQVLGPNEMLIQTGRRLTLIRGVSTSGIVDGRPIRLSDVMEITGTHTYTTAAGGSNTVFLVEPFDKQLLAKILETAQQPAASDPRPVVDIVAKPKAAEWRTWTSTDGRFTVEAKLVSYALGKAKLEKRDGATVEVAPAQLSEDDQAFLRDELRRRR